jgi:hypothetical protein
MTRLELGHVERTLDKVEASAGLVVNQVSHVSTKQGRGAISLWVLWVFSQVVSNGVELAQTDEHRESRSTTVRDTRRRG